AGGALADLLRRPHQGQHPRPGGPAGAGAAALRAGGLERAGRGGERAFHAPPRAGPPGFPAARRRLQPARPGAGDRPLHQRAREVSVRARRATLGLPGRRPTGPEQAGRAAEPDRRLQVTGRRLVALASSRLSRAVRRVQLQLAVALDVRPDDGAEGALIETHAAVDDRLAADPDAGRLLPELQEGVARAAGAREVVAVR